MPGATPGMAGADQPSSSARAEVDQATPDGDLLDAFVTAPESQRQAAFRLLVERHGGMVAGVCRRIVGHDADDSVQAVFLVLARRAGELIDHPSVGGWLHRTALQVALHQRDARATRRHHEQEAAAMPPSAPSAESDTMRAEVRAELDAALDQLPTRYRAPLVLHYLEGRSQAEVAATLAVSVGTLTSLLSRAREHLRRRLARRGTAVPLVLLMSVLAGEAAAALPPAVVDLTCRVGSGGASEAVSALADAAGQGTTPAPAGIALGAVTLAAVVTGTLWWRSTPVVSQPPAGPPLTVTATATSATVSAVADPAMDAEVRAIFATLPAAVRARVVAAANGARLRECEIEQRAGARIYEVEIVAADGRRHEWVFTADGGLLEHKDTTGEDDDPRPVPIPTPDDF